MKTSDNIHDLAGALAKAQIELQNPDKTKTAKVQSQRGNYSYKYADIGDGLNLVRPILGKHGLSVVQATRIEDGNLTLATRLMHASGQWIESDYPVCGVNGQHQQMGAALTYARRYALFALVGVAAEEDADGHAAEDVRGPKVEISTNPRRDSPRNDPPGKREREYREEDRADAAGAKAIEAARAEAETYVERCITEMESIESLERWEFWWASEKKNRQLHFTTSDDPLFVRLKDAAGKRKAELAALGPDKQEAAE